MIVQVLLLTIIVSCLAIQEASSVSNFIAQHRERQGGGGEREMHQIVLLYYEFLETDHTVIHS